MDESRTRRILAALADHEAESTGPAPTDAAYSERIDRAVAAAEDLEAAAQYLEHADLDALETAVERAEADLSASAAGGRDALGTLRRLDAATSSGPDGPTI